MTYTSSALPFGCSSLDRVVRSSAVASRLCVWSYPSYRFASPAALDTGVYFTNEYFTTEARLSLYLRVVSFVILMQNISSASFFKPIDWVREKLSPAPKESQDEDQVKAAKEMAKKDGTANVFEDLVNVTPPEEQKAGQRAQGLKTRFQSVCGTL